jgi:hypothetical protein
MLNHLTKGIIYKSLVLGDAHLIADDLKQMSERDWADLINVSHDHRLGPVLYQSLARDSIVELIPENLIENLQAQYQLHRIRNLKAYQALAELVELFKSNNIASVALKGSYLSIFAYPDIALRPMRDLDLLIPEQQVIDAYDLLIEKGYKRLYGSGGPESALETAHHLPALVSSTGIVVELHHRITQPAKYEACLITQNIWSKAIVRKVGKVDVQFASPEDLLIHLCEHASIHHLFNVGPLILSDINYLVNTHELDWGYILQATEEYQLTRALLITLVQVSTKLNTKIPKPVLQTLGVDQLDLSVLDTIEDLMLSRFESHNNMSEHNTKILYANSTVEKIKALVDRIFVSTIEIANEFPVSARSLLVYFYYPLRWWRQTTQRGPALMHAYHNKNTTYKLAMQKQQLGHWLQDNH